MATAREEFADVSLKTRKARAVMGTRKHLLVAVNCTVLGACISGYEEFYRPGPDARLYVSRRVAAPTKDPAIEYAAEGNIGGVLNKYNERGYGLIGHASFTSGRSPSDDDAVKQAVRVGADLVVIVSPTYAGAVTTSLPITTPTSTTTYTTGTATVYGPHGSATAYGSGTSTTYGSTTTYVPITIHRYQYGALFFVKYHAEQDEETSVANQTVGSDGSLDPFWHAAVDEARRLAGEPPPGGEVLRSK